MIAHTVAPEGIAPVRGVFDPVHAERAEKSLQLFRQNFERTLSMIGEMRIEALASEEPARQNARRSRVPNRNIPAGKIIDKDDLTWKRPAGGISPRHYYEVLGMAARADIEEDTVLQWAHLE